MDTYSMVGAPDAKEADQLIYATHPAPAGTYIVYAHKDGTCGKFQEDWATIEEAIEAVKEFGD